jgi:hypothetical protein
MTTVIQVANIFLDLSVINLQDIILFLNNKEDLEKNFLKALKMI